MYYNFFSFILKILWFDHDNFYYKLIFSIMPLELQPNLSESFRIRSGIKIKNRGKVLYQRSR